MSAGSYNYMKTSTTGKCSRRTESRKRGISLDNGHLVHLVLDQWELQCGTITNLHKSAHRFLKMEMRT